MTTELLQSAAVWSNPLPRTWPQIFDDAVASKNPEKTSKGGGEESQNKERVVTRSSSKCSSAGSSPQKNSPPISASLRSRMSNISDVDMNVGTSSSACSSYESQPTCSADGSVMSSQSQDLVTRGRGRPRKSISDDKPPDSAKRPVGRPKKCQSDDEAMSKTEKRPVGRPKKADSSSSAQTDTDEEPSKPIGKGRKRHLSPDSGHDARSASSDSGSNSSSTSSNNNTGLTSAIDVFRELRESLFDEGIWIQCSICSKWRHLPSGTDPAQQPAEWNCSMNGDKAYNNCLIEQRGFEESDEEMIFAEFSVGSIVWARTPGFPWWPAMVDLDPNTLNFHWLTDDGKKITHYNVTYFDEKVSRAWVTCQNIRRFGSPEVQETLSLSSKHQNYAKQRELAVEKAKAGLLMSVEERANKFGFIGQLHQDGHLASVVGKMGAGALQKDSSSTSLTTKTSTVPPIQTASNSSSMKKLKKDHEKDKRGAVASSTKVPPVNELSMLEWLAKGPRFHAKLPPKATKSISDTNNLIRA